MEKLKINLSEQQLFTTFVLFWVGLGALSLFLAAFGIFYSSILVVYLILAGAFFLYLVFINRKSISIGRQTVFVGIISLLAIFLFSYFTVPTIFSGRDQGSLSSAAIGLSQNHNLKTSFLAEQEFFKIYGEGKALNFPGFNYTQQGDLVTHFPLGYISWLAAFYSILGLNGFILANAVSFLIFILSFYLLAKNYLKNNVAMVAVLMVLTSFIFSWFFKFTLSENLMLGLLWFSLYELILFTKTKNRFFFLVLALTMGFLCFVRIEALAFSILMLIFLYLKYKKEKKNIFAVIGKKNIIVLGGIALVYLLSLIINKEFYVSLIKGALKSFSNIASSNALGNVPSFLHVGSVFVSYALINFLIFAIFGIIYLLRHKKYDVLVPLFILFPAFIYFFIPSISSDHPWMLRRFVFAVVPICIFYTVWFVDNFFKKRAYFYAFFGIFLILNLSVFIPYIGFSPDKNLLSQVEKLSDKFNDSDLILIDREATGDAWSMMSGPMHLLYGKQAVYFFNPADINKLDTAKFTHVYFIIPDKNIDFYKKDNLYDRLEIREDYAIENESLGISNCSQMPVINKTVTQGKIYLLK